MHLEIHVTVSSDDGSVSETTINELCLATAVYGTDRGVAKQDFLTQAESLLRTVSENQLPALYETVRERSEEERKIREAEESEGQEEAPSQAQANVRKQLDRLRDRANADAGTDAGTGEDAQ